MFLYLLWLLCIGWLTSFAHGTTIAAGEYVSCALTFNRQLKCWGTNNFGTLGQGHTRTIGDNPSEMGEYLPPINLGTGRTAAAIVVGKYHCCAVLDNGLVKCWGLNTGGQLGQGHSTNIGGNPNDMGDNLAYTNLGTGRKAMQISASTNNEHVCVVLDNGQAKCWGWNANGQLGQGHTQSIGGGPDQMGDFLPPIDLGTGRTAVQISVGLQHTCAILDNGLVKCWGNNLYGQLGHGTAVDSIGGSPNQMGDNLPYTNLGTGRTVLQITTGYFQTCAILDNGQVKCWGYNFRGQLGQGHNTAFVGKSVNDMGDNLPYTNLGTGRKAVKIWARELINCALLDNGRGKCWGYNFYGQFGLGYTSSDTIGDGPGEMGDSLPYVITPTGRTIQEISVGRYHSCARLDNGDVKCWGMGTSGATGQGHYYDTTHMGDDMPVVSINDCVSLNCGPLSYCINQPEIGESTCKCEKGYFYDSVNIRDIANFFDFDSFGKPSRLCRPIDVSIKLSNYAVQFRVKNRSDLNTSVAIGLTNGNLNPLLFGPSFPIPHDGIIPGNMTLVVPLQESGKYTYNGQEFYIIVKSMENNVTIASDRFILPCGCDANEFLDYPPAFPRPGDGRPIPGRVVQRRGKMFVSWTDNSNCATQFSLHRILPNEPMAQYLAGFQDDAGSFGLSDEVYTQVVAGDLTSVSVVSDFVLDSTNCFKRFAPIQFLDDMTQSRLVAGARVIYCMTASNPSLNFASGFSCVDQLHSLFEVEEADLANGTVSTCTNCRRLASEGAPRMSFNSSGSFFWETQFRVRVLAGKYTNTPVKNVNISWSVTLEEVDESGPEPVDLSRPIILSRPSMCISNANGECEVSIIASTELNPGLLQSSVLSVAVFATKTSIVPWNHTVEHSFTCEEPARNCSEDRPLVIETAHLVGGNIYVFRDMTTVAVSGKVTIEGTQDSEYGVELGCPLQGAEVCAYAADMEQEERNKFDCTKSAANGDYTVVVPMQKSVELVVTMKDSATNRKHDFAPQGWDGAAFKVGLGNVQGKHFMDITKETLYVDVFGGNCQFPLASGIEVELTKKRSGCGTWAKRIYSSDAVMIPPTFAPTQEPTTSPTLPTTQPTMSPDSPPTRNPTTKAPSTSPSFSPIESGVITNHPTRLPSRSPTSTSANDASTNI